MKKLNHLMPALVLASNLFLFTACSKQKDDLLPEISDSIYGTYVSLDKEDRTGDWTDIFVGTIIKVKPGNAPYFTIAISGVMNGAYPTVFDSVRLATNNTFSIDRYVPDPTGTSPTGLAHLTGTGNFSTKRIALNFSIIYRETPLLHSPYNKPNASKTSDNYD